MGIGFYPNARAYVAIYITFIRGRQKFKGTNGELWITVINQFRLWTV